MGSSQGQILGQLTPVWVGIISLNASTALGTTPMSVSPVSHNPVHFPNLMELDDLQITQTPPTIPNPETIQPSPEDRFPQPTPSPEPLRPDESPPLTQPEPTPSRPTNSNVEAIQIEKINVTGSTIFEPEDFNPIVQPLEGEAVTLQQLQQAADAITQLYLNRGYITSRAILVDQVITDGVVEIFVLEGSLEEIKIEGIRRLKPSYIRNRIQLGVSTPLNTARVEDKLRLLRANPLFESVDASLRAGSQPGKSNLIIRVVEANPFEGSLTTDNYSPPSVGSERLGVNGRYRNLTGYGDELTASSSYSTTGGSKVINMGYRLPLNPKNGTLQVQASVDRNQITAEPFAQFGIQGESEQYEISFSQPLIRTSREEFSLSLAFSFRDSQTFFLDMPAPLSPGADIDGITRTSVIQFGQDYLRRDSRGAWSVRSLFSLGTGWLDATVNPDPIPDGRFLTWLGQIQRVQIFSDSHFLIMGADIQLSPNTLLPSQQFVIGGAQSVRGYRQNARIGDNGVRLFLEDRITLEKNASGASTFQIAPFFDAGWVWNNPDNQNPLPQEQFLASLGMGILWQPLPGLDLRLDYGLPLVELEDQGQNAQDQGFHFSVRYQF
ncbi:outer membrane protein, OMP85 family, putative [Coleofasciculus chthonoplastes PCC 7420]|uniref:Outer membrane protein, OMP85 family, putative n=1 Tax=Coleofasciculus chthonoplastes PCC 7420 TaxID=118168 RepID=B4VPF8_9CYAN|nr:ShlB/FhaC/HecB family hemolysin secretion/activation protein [Coleofasciculus chthonoplastes]EDX76153.1 outer membrane protein, OMP85 family, putative [Coleofasciculus chthonoplastes PCC 7420]